MWSEAVKDKAMKAVSCRYAFNILKKSALQHSTGLKLEQTLAYRVLADPAAVGSGRLLPMY